MGKIASSVDFGDTERDIVKRMAQLVGTEHFLNSGVLDRSDYQRVFGNYLTTTLTDLSLGSLVQHGKLELLERLDTDGHAKIIPHIHRGGELAWIMSGSYVDVTETGEKLAEYKEGDIVLYTPGSAHIPVTGQKTSLIYRAYDGMIFGDNILERMIQNNIPEANQDFVRNVLMRK